MIRISMLAAAALAASACGPAPEPAQAEPTPQAQTSAAGTAAAETTTTATAGAQNASSTGPLDGDWRCKMIGDIPIGVMTFKGRDYTFASTNTAWEKTPNSSDGSGQVTFIDNTLITADSGPLKTEFEVTGAYGDGSFINWNNNLGMLFGCRRP